MILFKNLLKIKKISTQINSCQKTEIINLNTYLIIIITNFKVLIKIQTLKIMKNKIMIKNLIYNKCVFSLLFQKNTKLLNNNLIKQNKMIFIQKILSIKVLKIKSLPKYKSKFQKQKKMWRIFIILKIHYLPRNKI